MMGKDQLVREKGKEEMEKTPERDTLMECYGLYKSSPIPPTNPHLTEKEENHNNHY